MPALRAPGIRVVATPAALDAAVWHNDWPEPDEVEPLVLRFAPDDAFGIGAASVDVHDQDAIVVEEDGFLGLLFDVDEFDELVRPHIEWPVPPDRPAFAQGSIAGVPAKLYLDPEGAATILVAAAYAHELEARLGWRS